MKQSLLALALMGAFGLALAKLPPPDDAAKAKAAETKAKADWQAKADAFLLCKAQDRVAARVGKSSAKDVKANGVKPVVAAGAAPATPAAQPGAAAPAGTAAPTTGTPGTPVASAPPPPCTDPGPFAYAPPEQKPLESSGAHSPAPTAASAPSVRPHTGAMDPGTKK